MIYVRKNEMNLLAKLIYTPQKIFAPKLSQ
jgi:hypothetical protein